MCQQMVVGVGIPRHHEASIITWLLLALDDADAQTQASREIGIGGASRPRPSHTTVRTGPYTAVRLDERSPGVQSRQSERVEVGIGQGNVHRLGLTETPRAV